MKIAMVAPFEEPVPPQKYGGTERIVHSLTEELVRQGHEVTLFASGDSLTSAAIVPIFPQSLRADPLNQDPKVREINKYLGLGRVIEYLHGHNFDIIHNHLGWRLLPFLPMIKQPVITTMHGPLDNPGQQIIYNEYPRANYVSISENQRKPMPYLNYVDTVYNGIDVESFLYQDQPGVYYAFLGRMSPEKGPVEAIKIAKAAGVRLLMGAKVDAVDKEYFESKVAPLIDGEQIIFLGELDHEAKNQLLKGARALIAPIQWEEPFGLYFVEAFACGTPVISFARGSVPEIVVDGQNGFICQTLEEMANRIGREDELDRLACRRHAESHFSVAQMAEGYLRTYKKVIGVS